VSNYSTGKGYDVLKGVTNLAKSNGPRINPPTLIGSDFAQINLLLNPKNLLTFSNIVNRVNSANTVTNVKAQGLTLTIPPGSTLQFILSGVAATPVVLMYIQPTGAPASPHIIIGQGILGGGSYRLFQAQVDPAIATGIVYAQLFYQST
jgi:hypothetical protein